MGYFSSVLSEPAAEQAWRLFNPVIQRDTFAPGGRPQNVAGRYSDLSQIPIGQDVKRQLFAKLGMGGGEGYQSWMGDTGVNEAGQPVANDQLSQAGIQALQGYQFDWQPSGTRNEGILSVIGPDGKAFGEFNQSDPSTASQMLQAAALAAAGFGGAGLMFGVGPAAGMFGASQAGNALQSVAQGGVDAWGNTVANSLADFGLQNVGGAVAPAAGDAGMAAALEAAGSAYSPEAMAAWGLSAGVGAPEIAGIGGATGGIGQYLGAAKDSASSGYIGNATAPQSGVNLVNAGGQMPTGGGIPSLLSDGLDFLKGNAGSLASIASGMYGMNLAGNAREASDPFAPYRAGYAEKLAALEANPASIVTRPGFEAGLEAIQRKMGATGYLGSGNMIAALSRYSGDFYNQEANRLATLAGAGQTPGAGQFQSADLAGRSLGSVGYGLGQLLERFVGRGG